MQLRNGQLRLPFGPRDRSPDLQRNIISEPWEDIERCRIFLRTRSLGLFESAMDLGRLLHETKHWSVYHLHGANKRREIDYASDLSRLFRANARRNGLWRKSGRLPAVRWNLVRSGRAEDVIGVGPLVLGVLEDMTMPKGEPKPGNPSLRRCPACSLPLQQCRCLNDTPIVLDTCTNCGGFWVEDGEVSKMQQYLDQVHEPVTKEEEANIVVAVTMIEHEAAMNRQRNLLRLIRLLRQYQSGWIGLIP